VWVDHSGTTQDERIKAVANRRSRDGDEDPLALGCRRWSACGLNSIRKEMFEVATEMD
jgi:hypothetical protein